MTPRERTEEKLLDVHPDLVAVVRLALTHSPVPFIVTEGVRSLEKQKKLFELGATRTLKSRHLRTTAGNCHAVDVAAWLDVDADGELDQGEIRWDWPLYRDIAFAMKGAAQQLNVPLVWGGDWQSLKDGPHFELDRRYYP